MTRKRSKRSTAPKGKNPKSSDPLLPDIISSFNGLSLASPHYTSPKTQFEDLGISSGFLKGIYAYGLEIPSAVQLDAIPYIKKGEDVIIQAQSGMGKTAAYCIGTLGRIDIKIPKVQCLVAAPTRELAEQICEVYSALAQFTKVKILVCIGGTPVRDDKMELAGNDVHIVVGTLGRLSNLINDGSIQPLNINMFVLDEADLLLSDRTFERDIANILLKISEEAQIISASATMPKRSLKEARSFMRNPKTLLINKTDLTLEGIQQFYVNVNGEQDKLETLRDLIPYLGSNNSRAIIFCSTRNKVKWLNRVLNFAIPIMNGEMCQKDREKTLEDFRIGNTPVLITSDLLGRGIDIQQLYAVINYDLPSKTVEYIHRVGRSGRYGRKGLAITLADAREQKKINAIAEYYQADIRELDADFTRVFKY